ncbi:maleylpyruvate isomerase family mycothiol-dependent enzyme [Ruania albidiflava]|uniref:maleylpyruvate isomerase family mycothiol-dependent enzyme n=1 Tax=Ruania albidiflava TaxID=366586 RepID=UPI0003B63CAA|nr:maleylpyruvate isomerase family mycothiol-dependent enzyme [Ruania albidiflava]
MTDTTSITEETYAERARLAALLATLCPQQWAQQTLCSGWRVREVVAHMTAPFHTAPLRMLAGILRAGLSYDRYAARAARADTARMDDERLLQIVQQNLRTPWPRSAGGAVGGLSHDVIHGLDITEPLGLERVPAARVARVLGLTSPRSLAYFGVDLSGCRLVATDADAAIGTGANVPLPAHEILLVVTGRHTLAEAREREGI